VKIRANFSQRATGSNFQPHKKKKGKEKEKKKKTIMIIKGKERRKRAAESIFPWPQGKEARK
jgi:hypothetical protein